MTFLQSAGETERGFFITCFAGGIDLVSVSGIGGAGDVKTPALARPGSVRSVMKEPGFLVLGLELSVVNAEVETAFTSFQVSVEYGQASKLAVNGSRLCATLITEPEIEAGTQEERGGLCDLPRDPEGVDEGAEVD